MKLLIGRYKQVSDALRESDPYNFHPHGWLIKKYHLRNTCFKGFYPIDQIYAASASATTATANTCLAGTFNDTSAPIN